MKGITRLLVYTFLVACPELNSCFQLFLFRTFRILRISNLILFGERLAQSPGLGCPPKRFPHCKPGKSGKSVKQKKLYVETRYCIYPNFPDFSGQGNPENPETNQYSVANYNVFSCAFRIFRISPNFG